MKRVRRSPEEIKAIIAEWKKTEMSVREFCLMKKIDHTTIYKHLREEKQKLEKPKPWIKVEESRPITVSLKLNGNQLEFEEKHLRQIIKAII